MVKNKDSGVRVSLSFSQVANLNAQFDRDGIVFHLNTMDLAAMALDADRFFSENEFHDRFLIHSSFG